MHQHPKDSTILERFILFQVADLELASQTTVVLQDELGQGDDAMDIGKWSNPSIMVAVNLSQNVPGFDATRLTF